MYSREESSLIKQEFWTIFGKYMTPIRSSEGLRVNWINYKTGIKDVYFRMETLGESAAISISIEHNDPGIRDLFFEQFPGIKADAERVFGRRMELATGYCCQRPGDLENH
ncbi:MAG: DUF4268 domain-containing protein [Bacteroidota bacterium]